MYLEVFWTKCAPLKLSEGSMITLQIKQRKMLKQEEEEERYITISLPDFTLSRSS